MTDKEEIVSAFNEHFVNVGHSLADKIEVKSTDAPIQFTGNLGGSLYH